MPSSSDKQKKFVLAKRNEYGSKENTPDKWTWIWEDSWLKVEKILEDSKGHGKFKAWITPDKELLIFSTKLNHKDVLPITLKYESALKIGYIRVFINDEGIIFINCCKYDNYKFKIINDTVHKHLVFHNRNITICDVDDLKTYTYKPMMKECSVKFTTYKRLTEEEVNEAVEYDYVVRDGKKVRKAKSTKKGYKIDTSGTSPKEVKASSSEIRNRKKGAIKASRKPTKSAEINKRKKSTNKRTWESINEDISIPLNKGDAFKFGKFKNKTAIYDHHYTNEKGDLIIVTDTGKIVPMCKIRLIQGEK